MPKVNVVSFVLVALASAPCYVTHLYIDFMTSGRECMTSLIACYVYQFFAPSQTIWQNRSTKHNLIQSVRVTRLHVTSLPENKR